MKLIRLVLGKLILLLDAVFSPRRMKRSSDEMAAIAQKTQKLALYEFNACPFCVKVRRAMKRLNISVERRDAKTSDTHRQELLSGGGRVKVPCLRIEDERGTTWMYESNDIVAYLESEFSSEKLRAA